MTDQPKFDEAPEESLIDLMSKSYSESPVSKTVPMDKWGKDKSSDFYLGMMAAIIIADQACNMAIATGAPVEALLNEFHLFNGQLSTILKEKQSRIILV